MGLLIERFQGYKTTVDEARKILRDDSAGHAKWALAMAVIGTAFEISTEIGLEDKASPTAFEDMLLGLKRGNLAASSAICLLHGATQRPWPEEVFGSSGDPKEWEEYLRSNGFLTD
jgi:hypothetical protein